MLDAEHLPLADVKNRLSEVVEMVEREHTRVVVTKHGRPAAVLLSIDDLESLEETLDVLGQSALVADIAASQEELAAGAAAPLDRADVQRLLDNR